MPELPEVETVRRTLEACLSGRTVAGVEVLFGGCVADGDPAAFAARVKGQRITAVVRRGKYLLFRFASGDGMWLHLRMTGQAVLAVPADPPQPHCRLRIFLDDGRELRFGDVRKFGRVGFVAAGEEVPGTAGLGPEPLTPEFTVDALRRALHGRVTAKGALLDQRRIAGLGNIYADEALFRAGIHPARRAETLTDGEVLRLHAAIEACLAEALAYGGTTFRSYVQADGSPGGYTERLRVYGRHGLPCVQCGTPLERTRVAGRGTVYCPRCQR